MRFRVGHHTISVVKTLFKTLICPIVGKKKINHQSPMQTEKSQPEVEWIMPEMRFKSQPSGKRIMPAALSVYPRVGISPSALETNIRVYLCIESHKS